MNVVAFSNVSLGCCVVLLFFQLFVPLVIVLCLVELLSYIHKSIFRSSRARFIVSFSGAFFPVASWVYSNSCCLIFVYWYVIIFFGPFTYRIVRTRAPTHAHARTSYFHQWNFVLVFLIITAIITGPIVHFAGPPNITHCIDELCEPQLCISLHCECVKIKSALHRARKIPQRERERRRRRNWPPSPLSSLPKKEVSSQNDAKVIS